MDKQRQKFKEERDNMTTEEKRKRAQAARERMLKRNEEMNYCEICEPSDTQKGKYVVGKGVQCAHGKTVAPKL